MLVPHGVRGVLKVESWCDDSKVLAAARRVFLATDDGKYKEMKVLSGSPSGKCALLRVEGIETREDAQSYKNKILYFKREDVRLGRGKVFVADIIGLPVIDKETARVYGTVSEVDDGVRYKLYTVKTDNGDVILPGVPEFIKEIDTERGVFVTVIPGFFEDEI